MVFGKLTCLVYETVMIEQQPKLMKVKDLFLPLRAPDSEFERAVYQEQVSQIISLGLVMGLVTIANGVLVSAIFYATSPVWKIAAWLVPLLMYSGYLAYSSRKLSKKHAAAGEARQVSGRFMRMAETGAVFQGMAFGASAILFLGDSVEAPLFLATVFAGMSAGVSSLLSSIPRVTLRYNLGSVGLLIIANLLYPAPYSIVIITLAVIMIAALTAGNVRNHYRLQNLISATSLAGQAKLDLVDAIEATRDAFTIYDAEGNRVLANARFREWFPDGVDLLTQDTPDAQRLPDGRWVLRSSRPTSKDGRVVVHTDISTLKQRERELIEAQKEAVQADEAKSRFLSTMSHELRTPLNIILGFAELMAPGSNIKLTEDEVQEYADNIHKSGAHLLNLIDDIIDYSKVGLDKYRLDPHPVDVRDLLVRSVTLALSYQKQIDKRDVEVSISPKLGDLLVDAVTFRRILVNLVSNAIKFQGADKRIIIKAGLYSDGRPFIAVRDFGKGMNAEQLERAFEAFYQADPDLTREQDGTGLGLTLSRHLARLHGGDLILKSREGVGTSATVVLPQTTHIGPSKHAPEPLLKAAND